MTRLALAVLLVVAAAASSGCGSDQDPTLAGDVPTSPPSSSTSSSRPVEPAPPPDATACTDAEPGKGDDLTLGIAHGTLRSGAPVTWTLTVTNGGDAAVELVFPSGQDGDVTLTRDGAEAYRWSDGMAFTQAIRCQELAPGATATYELPEPVLEVDPGEYQLRASVAAEPKPFDVAATATVEG
jgi:hypothetical protein